MIVNNYKIRGLSSQDRELILPIDMQWGISGLEQSIELYEEDIIKDVIGVGNDYEVDRFSHEEYGNNTKITYSFNFYSGTSLNTIQSWSETFLYDFSVSEIFYKRNVFTNSFFKLDFYDTTTEKRQKNYLTVILNADKGIATTALLSERSVLINKPVFDLDYVGNREGFFIYWLKNEDLVGIDTFYVSCKFYNAKNGSFTRMMRRAQSSFSDSFDFDATKYFYVKLVFDYNKKTYKFYDINTNNRITNISWFEYVNP